MSDPRVTDARALALDVTIEVGRGARSDEALARALDASVLEGSDRGLATRLVYGTIARQRTLDHTIAARAGRAVEKIDAPVLAALRLGLFQIAYLDRVPPYAAVSTSVDLVRRHARSATGFVNAVLRSVLREGMAAPPENPPARRLGIECSAPDWLVAMWTQELGAGETEKLLAASLEPAPTAYRALRERGELLALLAESHIAAAPGRYGRRALTVAGEARAVEGMLIPQGEASQLVVEMLDPQPGQRVLDACAAPGGKTAYIASMVGEQGSVTAVDDSPSMRSRIDATLRKSPPVSPVTIHPVSIEEFADSYGGALFDAVLVDAPCSGLGTLRQHPEIRWRRSASDIRDLANRQQRILQHAANLLRAGGRLLYSTCTISRVENDEVIEEFLRAQPSFERVARHDLPAHLAALCDVHGTLRTSPHRHGIDGFYAVALRKTQAAG
ncbi:MAG TPA: 16S rRNA (cytosine(967)-C(5))-methyltransferase RsmB [Candidatus Binatia bacterium]|nr:16S rRNA (cytosine(967)-C(5))-methyltransferase RsmB [Candidatus Binatia bacterium]